MHYTLALMMKKKYQLHMKNLINQEKKNQPKKLLINLEH